MLAYTGDLASGLRRLGVAWDLAVYDSDQWPPTGSKSIRDVQTRRPPNIDYTGNWKRLDSPADGVEATQAGSSVTLIFVGTQVIWVAEWTPPSGLASKRSIGQYWIDGGEPVTFNLIPAHDLDPPILGSNHFKVDGLLEAAHNLTVVYNDPSTPLVLSYLLVQGGDYQMNAERPKTPPPPPPPSDSSSGSVSAGVIAAGAVVGLALVTLALLACFFVMRWKEKIRETALANSNNFTYPFARPHPSSSTPEAARHSPRVAVNPSLTPSNNAIDQQPHNDSTALQGPEAEHDPLAAPSTLAVPTILRAHGVTTNQGDFTLAGCDVHVHKHYHWRGGRELDNTQDCDGATSSHLLPRRDGQHLLDDPVQASD
ncbi:hypothetical protein BKA70DRAFT_1439005 [Coprinopsis sp. MPI-PUGE-AT-0042]|nr:hypothetical protein BKA70DRAFT_1439005 [Coprinopsis sp. MPI-PUGE-AT-0042]